MRLFLGLEIPTSIKNRIQSYLENIKSSNKGWENPADYHITILFIGECGYEEKNSIVERMKSIQFNQIHLKTNGFHFFNRRVLYLGFENSPELLALKQKVNLLFPEWFMNESKPFVPHITVKRWQRYEFSDLAKKLESNRFNEMEILINNLSLFKLEKDQANNKYHVIEKRIFV